MTKLCKVLPALAMLLLCSCGGDSETAAPGAAPAPLVSAELSNRRIHSIVQDADGYIWLGTFRGLNRFNAHEFYQYFHTERPTSLTDNQVTHLFNDSRGWLWIATVGGINRYTDSDNFVRVPFGGGHNYTSRIFEAPDGRIYAVSLNRLGVYNPDTDSFDICLTEPEATFYPFSYVDGFAGLRGRLWLILDNTIFVYDKDTYAPVATLPVGSTISGAYMDPRKTTLWLATRDGLKAVDADRCRAGVALPQALAASPLASSPVSLLHGYDDHSMLINSRQSGLYLYDFASQTLVHQDDDGFPFDVPDFIINTLYTDRRNNLWIGSYDQGYAVRSTAKERFNNNNYLITQLQNKSVYSVAATSDGNLWIATLADGLFVYDSARARVFKADSRFADVTTVLAGPDDSVWLAKIFGNSVARCRYANNTLTVTREYAIVGPQAMESDAEGNVWVTTGGGQVVRIGADGEAESVRPSASTNFISGLEPLGDGKALIGQFVDGLATVDGASMTSAPLPVPRSQWQRCISSGKLVPTDLCHDSFGQLWIGTVGSGLLKYDLEADSIRRCPGISCSDIAAIEEDRLGNIWISTQYGLCHYDRSIDSISAFYTADGTGGNQYYDRASCMMPDGTLVFGGTHGLTMFDPVDVYTKRQVPLVFEDLKIHNRTVRPAANPEIIEHRLAAEEDIYLDHNHNGFSISFAALDYNKNASNHYFYKLEGHDKYWVDARNNHEAYYANLLPGTYDFRVRATNNNNSIEAPERVIRVHIKPAPWLSWWALTLYVLAFLGLLALIISMRMHYWRQVRRRKQAEHDRRQERHLNQMNMRFFANISHEFRTPLTMIAGPIAQLRESPNIDSSERRLLNVTERNVTRMLRLVNQMMDFNNLEDDTLRLQVEHVDVVSYLNHMVEIFTVNANEKGIDFKATGLEDSCVVWVDVDKIEKIASNLLSNAIKFTKNGGSVDLSFDVVSNDEARVLAEANGCSLSSPGSYIKIQLRDSGPGIPAESLQRIFDRYYRIESTAAATMGTGIGLYYARALANLHHGCLYAENRPASDGTTGSIFTLLLPTDGSAYRDDCKVEASEKKPIATAKAQPAEAEAADDAEKPVILVVDDDTDVVNYLRTLLSPCYNIVSCFDAESAYRLAGEQQPELVISDVLMPGTDGYELCRRLKDDIQLCHIPVILVTAKASVQNQIEGLNTGADAYVTKPFDPKYLLALIKSQLSNRRRARSIINRATDTETIEHDVLSGPDKAFMNDLYKLMEDELSNSELDITSLCDHLHISRTKLYYKIKGLTGDTPANFFKTYKLNRAAELIVEGKHNISEIADITGFSTPAHFSTTFKKHFGTSPSNYPPAAPEG